MPNLLKPGRRIDRYLIAEMLGPISLGFLVYTGMLLLRFLFQSAEMIIQRGLPVAIVGRLVAYSLPNIIVLTIPMALLFGILIALGRLSSDSELVALRSSGMSLTTLYRPILFLSLCFTLLNVYLMVTLLPRGNHALQQLRLEIITESVAAQVEPRVFYSEFEDTLLYVFERPKGEERWRGVFVAQTLPARQNEITIAEWGRIKLDESGERVMLELENAFTHQVDLDDPGSYNIDFIRRVEKVLEDRFTSTQREKIVTSKSLRELDLDELAAEAVDPGVSAEQRRLARVEIHKKFAIPAACLVFGIIALPLGFSNRRGGKSSGFVLSLAVFMLYYILLNNGENAARYGSIPAWVAMWMPNALLAVAGLLLLVRRNRDKSLMLSRIDRWVREDVWGRLVRFQHWRSAKERERNERRRDGGRTRNREAAAPEVVLRLPRLRLRVPNTMDRYVVRQFVGVFLLVMLSALTLYIIFDLVENFDEILENRVGRGVVLSYYKYLSLQIFYDLAPIMVLVTTLITFSLLGRTNEVTACKALGISLYRIALPAIGAAAVVMLLSMFLEAEVLPASNRKVARLEDQIKGRETSSTFRRADRQWLFGQDRFIYNYMHYDPRGPSLQRLQVFEFDQEHRLVGRLFTDRATYGGGNGTEDADGEDEWLFNEGWIRRFEGVQVTGFLSFDEPRRVDYPETPEFFDAEILPPEQMTYAELREYIAEVAGSGQPVPELKVELYQKLAYPAISLVMALVALPFAFRLGRQGALYGIGVSIGLGLVFVAIFAFFTTLGEAGALPPALAVWSPNLLFGMFAVYLFLGVRT